MLGRLVLSVLRFGALIVTVWLAVVIVVPLRLKPTGSPETSNHLRSLPSTSAVVLPSLLG